ncbi:uncharacterized protein LOC111382612 [Olea europaea var. sylvestris]|uniref:uncharacterized protein LOC111382612 n=1 Tax=Olea europaea var. sylvestris TaxID=158386 RepID=UPI000C1D8617|nr:uncharacterized protein LOC111382612 [Olea europaea var. sylvestris]
MKKRPGVVVSTGMAAVVTTDSPLSLIPQAELSTDGGPDSDLDFTQKPPPRRTSVANANGTLSPVTGFGSVTLSPSLQLSNALVVLSLSHKLLSVSQATKELNCAMLIYPTFCLLQDIFTR